MKTKEKLLDLCKINSISGDEKNIVNQLEKELENYSGKIIKTQLNSIIFKFNTSKTKSPKIALEAHIDTIGFIVNNITEEGFLKISNLGGIDPKVLISQEVIVLGKENFVGFVFKEENDEASEEKIKLEDLLVDVNLTKEEAEKNIPIGSQILFKFNPIDLKNNQLSVRFLDNRSSVLAILLILEKIKKENLDVNLTVIFSSQEETTQGGIKTAAYLNKPDVAVSVDVSFAKSLNCKEELIGEIGAGPLIGISPILDRNLSLKLIEIAEKNKIPHQLEIMNGPTRTNADELVTTKDGVLTSLVSIPIKNMHTPTELLEIKDIENTANLIYNFICSFKK